MSSSLHSPTSRTPVVDSRALKFAHKFAHKFMLVADTAASVGGMAQA